MKYDDEHNVFAAANSRVYHDVHGGITPFHRWDGAAAAQAAGYRPCRVCKPGR